jgi:pyruvate/2-oxoglutarate dehydrogenase complex dihydrolipoamide dehydrogenase (E3) component
LPEHLSTCQPFNLRIGCKCSIFWSLKIPTLEQYDALVLGNGEAGKYIAWHLAGSGKRTAVIERKMLGGSCPNVACLPRKNIIHSAKVASYFKRGAEFGVVANEWQINMSTVRERKREMVKGLREVHLANFAKSGAEVVMGTGRFTRERTLEVCCWTEAPGF